MYHIIRTGVITLIALQYLSGFGSVNAAQGRTKINPNDVNSDQRPMEPFNTEVDNQSLLKNCDDQGSAAVYCDGSPDKQPMQVLNAEANGKRILLFRDDLIPPPPSLPEFSPAAKLWQVPADERYHILWQWKDGDGNQRRVTSKTFKRREDPKFSIYPRGMIYMNPDGEYTWNKLKSKLYINQKETPKGGGPVYYFANPPRKEFTRVTNLEVNTTDALMCMAGRLIETYLSGCFHGSEPGQLRTDHIV